MAARRRRGSVTFQRACLSQRPRRESTTSPSAPPWDRADHDIAIFPRTRSDQSQHREYCARIPKKGAKNRNRDARMLPAQSSAFENSVIGNDSVVRRFVWWAQSAGNFCEITPIIRRSELLPRPAVGRAAISPRHFGGECSRRAEGRFREWRGLDRSFPPFLASDPRWSLSLRSGSDHQAAGSLDDEI
jgi:hypothetical protein